MSQPAYAEFELVADPEEAPANSQPGLAARADWPIYMTVWDVFAALQDAVDECGTTPGEADALVCATWFEFVSDYVP